MENLTIEQKLQLKKLRDLDVTKVEINYNGGGDDGCIDDFTAYTLNNKGQETYNRDIDLNSFEETFVDYIYELLSKTIEWDWVNNDGGYGTLIINMEEESISINHNQRFTEEFVYDIDTDKSLEILSKELKHGSSVIA